jgi:predicted nucleic acid-binding protein
MIVVDTNVLSCLWFKSPHFEKVAELLKVDMEWVVPDLCRSEFRNVAAAYLRRGYYSLDEINWIIAQKESKMLGSYLDVDSQEVMKLASQSTCSSYDCEFVALAKAMSTHLITFDAKIVREFPGIAILADQYIQSGK